MNVDACGTYFRVVKGLQVWVWVFGHEVCIKFMFLHLKLLLNFLLLNLELVIVTNVGRACSLNFTIGCGVEVEL